MGFVPKIGALVLSFPIGVGRGTIILFNSLHSVIGLLIGKYTPDVRNVILNRTSLQIYFTGVQTLPLLLSIGLFFAAALMGAGYLNLRSLGAENHFGELLRIGVLGELGPFTDWPHSECPFWNNYHCRCWFNEDSRRMDVLLSHDISIATYLVLPRIVGVWLSTLVLSILFVTTIYVSCWMIAPPLGLQFTEVFEITKSAIHVSDLTTLCLKATVFGLAIPMITIHHGFKVARNTQDLPRVGSQNCGCLSVYYLSSRCLGIYICLDIIMSHDFSFSTNDIKIEISNNDIFEVPQLNLTPGKALCFFGQLGSGRKNFKNTLWHVATGSGSCFIKLFQK